MFEFLNKPYPFSTDLRYSLKMGFSLSIGVFLFILFFKPLDLEVINIDSYLLLIAGFAGITLLVFSVLRIVLPMIFRKSFSNERWDMKSELFLQFLFWSLNSVAFSFYLAYVGNVPLTMFLAFKIIIICLTLPIMMMMVNEINILKVHLNEVYTRNLNLNEKIAEQGQDWRGTVELYSDNRAEKVLVGIEDLILIRSAENYVEVIYREEEDTRKKLLRTTMKSLEVQLRSFPEMIRCHRTCIVNIRSVEKLQRSAQGNRLRIRDHNEDVPVSRQYILSVKSALEGLEL